jgi:hypothetical protein
MSNTIYRYSFSVYDDDYVIDLMIGHNSVITPIVINLTDSQVKSYSYNCQNDDVQGLPNANIFKLQLDMNSFSNFFKYYFYNSTASLVGTLTLNSGKIIPFYYENTIKVTKNGTTIFIGVQEREGKTNTDSEGFYEFEFICILSKALQIIEPNESFLDLTGVANSDSRYLVDTSSETITYDDVVSHRFLFDFFYLQSSSVRGSLVKDQRDIHYRSGSCPFYDSVTFKYFFEYISGVCSELLTAWRRATTTMTINNPMNLYDFYKQNEDVDGNEGSLIAENDLRFIYMKWYGAEYYGLFGENSFNSIWEFFRVWFDGLPVRFKYDYVGLEIDYLGIIDNDDLVNLNVNVSVEGDSVRNDLLFVEINNQWEGNIDDDGPIGISKNEEKQYLNSIKKNNNGNLDRLELQSLFHNIPMSATDHRVGKWWASKIFNKGVIGYLRPISYLGIIYQTFVRAHHKTGFLYDGTNIYAPTPAALSLYFPDASKGSSNGGTVIKKSVIFTKLIQNNSTLPVINNYIFSTFLQGASLTLKLQIDGVLEPSAIGSMVTFSDYSFIPAWSSISVSFGYIMSIEYDFDKCTIEVIIAN